MESNKLPIDFKHLFDLLSDDEDECDDKSYIRKKLDIKIHSNNNKKRSLSEWFDEYNKPYNFPYENYKIVGDTTEIDKILYAKGHINIDVRDIEKSLSNETTNYISTGYTEGTGCIADALKDAVSKLPIATDRIADLLFNIWTAKTMDSPAKELQSMTEFLRELSVNIDCFWGIAYDDESLDVQQAKVTLIAASK